MATYPLPKPAGITQLEGNDPFFLYGGESDVVTDRAQVKMGLNLPIFTVLAFDAAGLLVAFDPAGATPLNKAIGILAEPCDATAANTWCPYFSGGQFNHEALAWPAATDTLPERRAAFAGSNIGVHRLP